MGVEQEQGTEAPVDQGTENQQVPEPASGESSDAFRKAFERTVNPDAVVEEPATPKNDESAVTPETPKALSEDEVKSIVSGLLESSTVSLRKQLDDLNGKFGGVVREVGNMKTTARPAAVSLTPGKLKRLKEQFPELAEVIEADLSEAFSAQQPEQPASQEPQKKHLYTDDDVKTLDEIHPDRAEIRQSPDYREWLSTLPEASRSRFLNSASVAYVSDKLFEFKEWREKKSGKTEPPAEKPPAQEPTQAAPAAPATNQARLESAVQPTNGTKAPVKGEPSPSERFRSAWKRTMDARLT